MTDPEEWFAVRQDGQKTKEGWARESFAALDNLDADCAEKITQKGVTVWCEKALDHRDSHRGRVETKNATSYVSWQNRRSLKEQRRGYDLIGQIFIDELNKGVT